VILCAIKSHTRSSLNEKPSILLTIDKRFDCGATSRKRPTGREFARVPQRLRSDPAGTRAARLRFININFLPRFLRRPSSIAIAIRCEQLRPSIWRDFIYLKHQSLPFVTRPRAFQGARIPVSAYREELIERPSLSHALSPVAWVLFRWPFDRRRVPSSSMTSLRETTISRSPPLAGTLIHSRALIAHSAFTLNN